jgi:type IV pilus assembly protein PilA
MFSVIQRLNDRRQRAGAEGEDAGFTLIELMVVLLILAILLAIAIPTFLGVTKSANDRASQSNLNTALLNAKAQYQNNSQAYPTTANLVTALASAEPSLSFQAGASTDQNHISVFTTADNAALVMAAWSKPTNNCWIVVDVPTQTAQVAATPFLPAGQTPAVAVNTPIAGGGSAVSFLNTQLGPTYAEIKTGSQAQCVASGPTAAAGSTYQYSFSAFPSI